MAMRRASRGSSKNQNPPAHVRREQKVWMLRHFGDGISAPCSFCGRNLLYSEISRDRYPVAGRHGGRYIEGNIRPACLSCNAAAGARETAEERAEAKRKHERKLARRRERYAQRKLDAALV